MNESINNNQPQNKEASIAKRVIKVLNQDFVVVGRRRAKAWQSWLFTGLIIGIVSGVVFVANQDVKFLSTSASIGQATIYPTTATITVAPVTQGTITASYQNAQILN